MKKILKYIIIGIGWGCIFSCIVNAIGTSIMGYTWLTESGHSYASQVVAAIISGIGWAMPAMVYENERLSRGVQILIHLGIGMIIYLPCSIYMDWIPVEYGYGFMIEEIMMMIVVYFFIYLGFFFYYRGEAKQMNKKMKENKLV